MRVAVLDLGTNTFNLLIADKKPGGEFIKVYKTKISVKLGQGGIGHSYIEERPYGRGLRALKSLKSTIEKYHVDKVLAVATSALRTAQNGKTFIADVKKRTDITVKLISGNREAELIYLGARNAVRMSGKNDLIMDIGGGSIEFIIANSRKIKWKKSFAIGVARLLEKFKPGDPISSIEITRIQEYLDIQLNALYKIHPRLLNKETRLIGTSGAFDSIAKMISQRFYHKKKKSGITEFKFKMKDFNNMHELLMLSSAAERVRMKGLTRMRIDMIVPSVIIMNHILKKLKIKKMILSAYALKEGVILDSLRPR